MELRGSMVAIVTPFKNGALDEEGLKKLIEWHIESGTNAIVPCGTTGESATLSYEEHNKVIDIVVKTVNKRISVIAGTGSNNTKEAIRLTEHAKSVGADGALIIAPYYNKPTQTGLYEHFKAISDSVDIPIVVYNIASRTGVNILPETMARISKLTNVYGIKEASGDLEQVSMIKKVSNETLQILSGDDTLTLPILAVGGTGVISVVANIIPTDVADMIKVFNNGEIEKARAYHYKMLKLVKAMFIETNPIPVKMAMSLMGLCDPDLRLPLYKISDANLEKLKFALKEYGLI